MSDYEVTIRLLEGEIAFSYRIQRGGEVVDCGTVRADEEGATRYNGGSDTMD